MLQARNQFPMHTRNGSRYINKRPRPLQMATNRMLISLAAILIFMSPIFSVGLVSTPVSAESQTVDFTPGEVVMVLTMPIFNGSGNSSDAEQAPHLVELHTATWCTPCRSAEDEVDELDSWWPDVRTISLHPSLDSPDELATSVSSEVYEKYNLSGYPSIIVDGHWTLLGDKQATDLQPLLANLSEDNLPRQGSTNLGFSWQMAGENFTLNWNLTSQIEVYVDFLISQDGVEWPGTSQTLDNVVRSGLTNLTGESEQSFSLNQSGSGNLTLNAIVRVSGDVKLVGGSEIPLFTDLPDTWSEPESVRSLSPKFIAAFSVIIFLLALIPMRHTVPVLFRKHQPIGGQEQISNQELGDKSAVDEQE